MKVEIEIKDEMTGWVSKKRVYLLKALILFSDVEKEAINRYNFGDYGLVTLNNPHHGKGGDPYGTKEYMVKVVAFLSKTEDDFNSKRMSKGFKGWEFSDAFEAQKAASELKQNLKNLKSMIESAGQSVNKADRFEL